MLCRPKPPGAFSQRNVCGYDDDPFSEFACKQDMEKYCAVDEYNRDELKLSYNPPQKPTPLFCGKPVSNENEMNIGLSDSRIRRNKNFRIQRNSKLDNHEAKLKRFSKASDIYSFKNSEKQKITDMEEQISVLQEKNHDLVDEVTQFKEALEKCNEEIRVLSMKMEKKDEMMLRRNVDGMINYFCGIMYDIVTIEAEKRLFQEVKSVKKQSMLETHRSRSSTNNNSSGTSSTRTSPEGSDRSAIIDVIIDDCNIDWEWVQGKQRLRYLGSEYIKHDEITPAYINVHQETFCEAASSVYSDDDVLHKLRNVLIALGHYKLPTFPDPNFLNELQQTKQTPRGDKAHHAKRGLCFSSKQK